MHSTKLTGLAFFFLINLFAFHTIFKGLADRSQAGLWLASICFGLIITYVLQLTAMTHKHAA